MRSLRTVGTLPVSLPLLADDIIEFHAARLLLLLHICGISGRIEGLTKMAKLDFFVRYPDFFAAARAASSPRDAMPIGSPTGRADAIESAMVRHHYGPWDKRYYHVLAHLESRGLIRVTKEASSYHITLTDTGLPRARALAGRSSFRTLVTRMTEVKTTFGRRSGNALKELIYRLFDEEVGKRPMGEAIR